MGMLIADRASRHLTSLLSLPTTIRQSSCALLIIILGYCAERPSSSGRYFGSGALSHRRQLHLWLVYQLIFHLNYKILSIVTWDWEIRSEKALLINLQYHVLS